MCALICITLSKILEPTLILSFIFQRNVMYIMHFTFFCLEQNDLDQIDWDFQSTCPYNAWQAERPANKFREKVIA